MLVESLIAVAFGLIGYWIGSNWPAKRHCPPHQYQQVFTDQYLPYFVCLKCGKHLYADPEKVDEPRQP